MTTVEIRNRIVDMAVGDVMNRVRDPMVNPTRIRLRASSGAGFGTISGGRLRLSPGSRSC